MLLLSDIVHREVVGPNGGTIGRIADVTARPDGGGGLPLAEHLVLSRRRRPELLVPWQSVNLSHPQHIRLNTDDELPLVAASPLADNEIMLVRDVLDTQIVDITGQRLTRVADVVLARRHDGRLEVVGVEVGFDAVLRRLGLGRLAKRLRSDAVAWTDLHPTSDRGHAVALGMPRSAIHLLDARGLAALVARLDTESAAEVLGAKDVAVAADVIRASHPVDAERILLALSECKAADVVAAMPSDHATRWRDRLSAPASWRNRHFRRFGVWPRRRHGQS
ncbi:magnesium transporter [Mycobacterium sp. 1164985.4]|uniref:magnesium transporter MgtE N-terminal domain-containing protein n=1 Tax=Mycobacterium sp. 1164985.4 TaxID=1834069 RepID=UPI000801A982|nr:magnesium transporter [Mycobacterium sp. 1164985.4]OBK75660.1 magnesium transporter [Mycobacterium sp. 1164985.4]